MEKNHFLDRHPMVNERNSILPGDEVFICLKNMQPYAKELQDLTKVTVLANLTSQEYHPRGQKIKGYEVVWDKDYNKYIQEERVGRVTYKIINGFLVPTKDGIKYIEKIAHNRLKLSTYDEIKNKFILNLVLKYEDFYFCINPDLWKYFRDTSEISEYVKSLKIQSPKLYSDRIVLYINGKENICKEITVRYLDKTLDINFKDFFEMMLNTYAPSNDSPYLFNSFYRLTLDSFEAVHPKEVIMQI